MGRWARCLAGLLSATLLPSCTGYAPNPPQCATDITGMIASLSEAAKRITWATDVCMPGWTSGFGVGIDVNAPPNNINGLDAQCSYDVSAAVKSFAEASAFMAKAAFVCGNVDSGCAQQVISVLTNVAAISQYASEAVSFCKVNRLWCVGSACDVAVSIVLMAQNIDTGIGLCSGIDYVPPLPGYEPGSARGEEGGFGDELDPDAPAPEPVPDAPQPVPDAPQPVPDAPQPVPVPDAAPDAYGDNLQSSFFPGMSLAPAERRLRAAVNASLDVNVVEEARRQRQELSMAMDRFRLQVKQALRKAELGHALQGRPLPEPLRTLEGRMDNATAQAKADAASISAERVEERMEELLAKFRGFERAAGLGAQAPVVV